MPATSANSLVFPAFNGITRRQNKTHEKTANSEPAR